MDQTKEIITRTEACLEIARQKYSIELPSIEIKFDLKGRTAGMFCWRSELMWFRYNRVLMAGNLAEFLQQTVPHEVAHYVVRYRWGAHPSPHGPEWKRVMREAFQLRHDRCHTMDVAATQSVLHVYSCECREHRLSVHRHNKIRRGHRYNCKLCKAVLTYLRQEVPSAVQRPTIERLFVSMGSAGVSRATVMRLQHLIAGSNVDSIVADGQMSDTDCLHLAKALGLRQQQLVRHPRPDTLPGQITHAIVLACSQSDRQHRMANALKSRGVVVRYVQPG
jgi:SprT protein